MKKYIKYIVLFIFFFIALRFLYIPFRMDTYNNYGFSYAIVNGQIPYKDFYLIVPLFSPILYSLLLVFSKSILIFYLEQLVLLLIFSNLLFKLLDKKAWIIITLLFCPYILCFTYCLFPGYNFLILLELVLLLYLNHYTRSDIIIGIVGGLVLLTKQNLGLFILLITIIYPFFKNKRSSLIRLVSSMLPITIFLIYLIISNTLYSFIDLCFLGLKSFNNNLYIEPLYLILFIITIIIMIAKFILSKNKNISYYYLLCYIPIIYPIIDSYHVSLFIYFSLIVYFYNTNINLNNKSIIKLNILIIFMGLSYYILFYEKYNKFKITNYHNFELELVNFEVKEDYDYIISFSKKHNNISFISDPSNVAFLTSTNKFEIDHYFVLFKGNYGIDGENKIYKEYQNTHNYYFVVQKGVFDSKDKKCQFLFSIPNDINKNCIKVKELNNFIIYYKE